MKYLPLVWRNLTRRKTRTLFMFDRSSEDPEAEDAALAGAGGFEPPNAGIKIQ